MPELPTGKVEIYVSAIEVLGPAAELPLPVAGEQEYPEDIRLKYRFLDLRREKLHQNIMTRGAIVDSMRKRMKEQGFFEFQTPILTASSPEGARDFLVPSRIHPGKFYALPQAPQQYKQLLMMSGFDRYFQIAPCFRDEDPRADRLPGEFYQLDVEMSFVEQDDVFAAMEPVVTGVFEEFAKGKPVTKGWRRIPFAEALKKYGSDKPDLRNSIEMQDVSEHFRGSGFKVFARMLEDPKNQVWAIPGPGGGSRAFCDRMNSWAQGEGQPGLGYIMWREGGEGAGPLANNIGPERTAAIRSQLGLKEGDAAFFVAGDPDKFWKFSGLARTKVGEELNLIDKDRFELAWIVDFPMYEYDETEKKVDFSHNPFSMPQGGLEALQTQDPLTIKAFQYDIVCNGYEIASGGIRNHKPGSDGEGVRDRGLWREGRRRAFRRHVSRVPVRRPAAWRHGGRCRPHRDAALRHHEPARDLAVPDEPAGRGPADGRAVGGRDQAAPRSPHPAQSAGQDIGLGPAHSPVEASIRNCASAMSGSVFRQLDELQRRHFAARREFERQRLSAEFRQSAPAPPRRPAHRDCWPPLSALLLMSWTMACRAASRLIFWVRACSATATSMHADIAQCEFDYAGLDLAPPWRLPAAG